MLVCTVPYFIHVARPVTLYNVAFVVVATFTATLDVTLYTH